MSVDNPRTPQQAVNWALKMVGDSGWHNLCERFTTRAYGWQGGYPTAIAHWYATPRNLRHYDRNPPAGALCFWSPNHTALSLGNGRIVSNDIKRDNYIDIAKLDDVDRNIWHLHYLGWTPPYFGVNGGRAPSTFGEGVSVKAPSADDRTDVDLGTDGISGTPDTGGIASPTSIPNPLDTLSQLKSLGVLGTAILNYVTDKDFWLRFVWFATGVAAIIFGVVLLARKPIMSTVEGVL